VVLNNSATNHRTLSANGKNWPKLSGAELGTALGIKNFTLYNDFELSSYGVLLQGENDLVCLNNIKSTPARIKSVAGVGNGIGVSMVVPVEVDRTVIY